MMDGLIITVFVGGSLGVGFVAGFLVRHFMTISTDGKSGSLDVEALLEKNE